MKLWKILMNRIKEIDVITPAFHSKDFIRLMIQSFEKFKPNDINIRYIVVENSDDTSYKEQTLNLSPSVIWVNNPTHLRNSAANAIGVEVGLKVSTSEYVFISHCDTLITSNVFIPLMIKKVEEGNLLVGTGVDGMRINAIHQSGMLVKSELARSVSLYPVLNHQGEMTHDVCDLITQRCIDENIKKTCFRNTLNDEALIDELAEPFKSFHVDRCLDSDGNVMFMHLGRGIPKQFNTYHKPNRVYFPQWVKFCEDTVLND